MGWLRFKIIGLFCRISSLLQGSFAKETYNLEEPKATSEANIVINNVYSHYTNFATSSLDTVDIVRSLLTYWAYLSHELM